MPKKSEPKFHPDSAIHIIDGVRMVDHGGKRFPVSECHNAALMTREAGTVHCAHCGTEQDNNTNNDKIDTNSKDSDMTTTTTAKDNARTRRSARRKAAAAPETKQTTKSTRRTRKAGSKAETPAPKAAGRRRGAAKSANTDKTLHDVLLKALMKEWGGAVSEWTEGGAMDRIVKVAEEHFAGRNGSEVETKASGPARNKAATNRGGVTVKGTKVSKKEPVAKASGDKQPFTITVSDPTIMLNKSGVSVRQFVDAAAAKVYVDKSVPMKRGWEKTWKGQTLTVTNSRGNEVFTATIRKGDKR